MPRIVFHVRPFCWFLERSWYSFFRWKYPNECGIWSIRLIDFGAITFGYRIKKY